MEYKFQMLNEDEEVTINGILQKLVASVFKANDKYKHAMSEGLHINLTAGHEP
jgi:hypothetical protein